MTVFEYCGDMIIVDCGLSFPDSDLLGVDLVIPDFTYVERYKDKVKGIVITHGHEDHIGGLPYLLDVVDAPIYATGLTIGLIEGKLEEHGNLNRAKLNIIVPGEEIDLGKFTVEGIHVNHSIPDSLALAIRCDGGTVVHTGDFKIDTTPIDGSMIDLARFATLGAEGVLCLMSDSTNAERPGYTESERRVGESIERLFPKAENKRIIVATFSSNIHRVQQIINLSVAAGRKVALSGRSLENVVNKAYDLGYMDIPENAVISIDDIRSYSDGEITIITTGSQGEPMSALKRMSTGEHKHVHITPNDFIIISANPIPGNELTVGKVIDDLMKLGAEVIYNQMYEVHVSGHARQEELKMIMSLVKPRYFIPVHGEQKHLRSHAAIAESIGIPSKNIIIADNGTCVSMRQNSVKVDSSITAGRVFIDGYGVGDVGNMVLRDRKRLSQDGLFAVGIVIDKASGELACPVQIDSRGFIYVKEADELYGKAKELVTDTLEARLSGRYDDMALRSAIKDALSRFLYERTKRSPMIVSIINYI
ncbi:MAG: ribonuclease J [Clostridia bacterium]|nr:ribonuclease J [Clostridia bacterium]